MDRDSPSVIYCPRGCGWYRSYPRNEQKLARIVHHPLYGPITQIELVQRDIQTHDCHEYLNAKIRLQVIRRNHVKAAA